MFCKPLTNHYSELLPLETSTGFAEVMNNGVALLKPHCPGSNRSCMTEMAAVHYAGSENGLVSKVAFSRTSKTDYCI